MTVADADVEATSALRNQAGYASKMLYADDDNAAFGVMTVGTITWAEFQARKSEHVTYVLDPKPDITAYELAIIMANNSNISPVISIPELIEAHGGAARHFRKLDT